MRQPSGFGIVCVDLQCQKLGELVFLPKGIQLIFSAPCLIYTPEQTLKAAIKLF